MLRCSPPRKKVSSPATKLITLTSISSRGVRLAYLLVGRWGLYIITITFPVKNIWRFNVVISSTC